MLSSRLQPDYNSGVGGYCKVRQAEVDDLELADVGQSTASLLVLPHGSSHGLFSRAGFPWSDAGGACDN